MCHKCGWASHDGHTHTHAHWAMRQCDKHSRSAPHPSQPFALSFALSLHNSVLRRLLRQKLLAVRCVRERRLSQDRCPVPLFFRPVSILGICSLVQKKNMRLSLALLVVVIAAGEQDHTLMLLIVWLSPSHCVFCAPRGTPPSSSFGWAAAVVFVPFPCAWRVAA
jgi:hypothetical protein